MSKGNWEIKGGLGLRYYANCTAKQAQSKYEQEIKHFDPAGISVMEMQKPVRMCEKVRYQMEQSINKRKGLSLQEQRDRDFQWAKGAIKKGSTLSKRDKQMIAVGRTQVHIQQSELYKYDQSRKPKRGRPKKEQN